MKRCLRLSFSTQKSEQILQKLLPSIVKKLKIEGVAQLQKVDFVEILMCGEEEQLDVVVDAIYEHIPKYDIAEITIEPFLQERNFRGVFRII